MIDHLDNMLRHLFIAGIDEITADTQVRFQPPDEDWRTFVAGQTNNVLNVYLFDLRENRKLRSNERIREVENGIVSETPAPRRVDLHYLISAWSPTVISPAVEPTVDEHALIYKVAGALTNSDPLIPRKVYDPDPLPTTFPQVIADAELPTVVLPAEGFPKYGEFWGTMGVNHRWRPAVYFIVTLPLVLEKEISGPMVTTRIAEYRFSGRPETAEVMIEIGGHVLLPAQLMAVGSATVTADGGGATPTVNNAAPFRIGDVVTVNNAGRATITQIQTNDLRLTPAIVGLANGNILRIANVEPTQARVRLNNNSTLSEGGIVIITGLDAAPPGNVIATERAVITEVGADNFVALTDDGGRACPPRTRTYRLDVAPADAPSLTPLATGAWVRLEDQATGTIIQTTTTDQDGRFRFGGLSEGNYILRVRAQGFAERTRNITVPSTTGEYDVPLV